MITAILLAAGNSSRAKQDKLQAKIDGKPVWQHSYDALKSHPMVDHVIIVDKEIGGPTRMSSFLNGIAKAPAETKLIIDHNAANPFVSEKEITDVIKAALEYGAAAVSLPAVDTLITEKDGFYFNPLDRYKVRQMQTPQAVRMDILNSINLKEATDLTTALLQNDIAVKIVSAHPNNRKITFASDLPTRSFIGEDSHRFSDQGYLKLGGLTITHLPAMEANSDGDVILHAIGRALAQSSDKSFSKIADKLCLQGQKDSVAFLEPLLARTQIKNLSLQIEAARPQIDKLDLRESLAKILDIHEDHIQIAAMTGEDLTPFGRGEGIRCSCILNTN